MLDNKNTQWIDDYGDALYNALSHMDLKTMEPIDFFHFYPIYSDLWVEKIYNAIITFEEKYPNKNITDVLPNASSMRAIFLFIIYRYRHDSSPDKVKYKKVIQTLLKAMKHVCPEDTFAFKSHICQIPYAQNEYLSTLDFQKTTPEIVRALGNMYLGASSLVNATFNDVCTDNGIDVYGPYDVSDQFGKGSVLVIKEFPRLRAVSLWKDLENLNFNTIRQYTVYKDVDVTIELVGCHFIVNGKPARESLTNFYLEVDGKGVNTLEGMNKINNELFEKSASIYQQVKSMNIDDLKQNILRQENHQFKDLFEAVGIDWKPSQHMQDRVAQKDLYEGLLSDDFNKETCFDDFGVNALKELFS